MRVPARAPQLREIADRERLPVAIHTLDVDSDDSVRACFEGIHEPSYRHVLRFSGLFRAALANPIPPETTAAVIRHIIESGAWQLRHPSGPDAAPFMSWRAAMTDEQWVDWSAQDDGAWYEQVQRDFGLDASPESSARR